MLLPNPYLFSKLIHVGRNLFSSLCVLVRRGEPTMASDTESDTRPFGLLIGRPAPITV